MSALTTAMDEIELPGGRWRVVDLSYPVSTEDAGHTGHKIKMNRGNFAFDGTYWHRVEVHSHLATHIELPRNISLDNTDAIDTPLTLGMGWLQLIDLRDLPPLHDLTRDDIAERGLDKVQPGDIPAVFGAHRGHYENPEDDQRVRLTLDVVEAFAERGIKGLCMDNSTISLERSQEECRAMHEAILGRNMLFFENFYTLHELPVDRVFLLTSWLPIRDLDSSPVRAIGLVPVDS